MSNKPIADMIETIEHFAQTQPSYPVYNVLGQEHTYGDLKADSDSLAAVIDQLGLPEKSPVVVFGGQEYEMLATFVALTKSGHAYIPIDSHSALERVSAILEVAEPSLIIAISAFPLEQVSTPMINLAQVQEAFAQGNNYEITHPVKGDDNYYIIFTSGTTGKPKGVQISHDNLLSFTNWMITDKEFATPSRPQMLAQPPYSFDLSVMYWAPTLALGGTLFTLPSVITQDFKQLFAAIFSLPIAIWTSTPSFADMAMLSEYFNSEKMPGITHFYFDGEELTVKTAEAFFEFEGLPAYHTGDVGTMTDEGLLLYGGRMDFQIKFNGYRIELEDVSQNLNKSRFIESAVAVPRYNKDHKVQNLLAYVILKDGVREQFERDIDITKAIKEDLTDIMMSYMMPSKFLYRDSLPLTPNGKIDIKGLINEVNKR
ncbi:D-alanine:Dcp ligase Dcl [Streptococcus pneumoniae]|nr:D-alanine:Dcp ligase Dcl [Streptococcus pneumoniae]